MSPVIGSDVVCRQELCSGMYKEGSPVRRSSGTPKTGFGLQFVHAIGKQRWIPFYLLSLGPVFWGFKK